MNSIKFRAALIAGCALFSVDVACAGDSGLYHNGIYLPPMLPEWGQEYPENKPTRYTIGSHGWAVVNCKLVFFIVKEIQWKNGKPIYIIEPDYHSSLEI
jgi:hypothetical protein